MNLPLKYRIIVGGKHSAVVVLNIDADGTFTGTIDSDEFGHGVIENGKETDGALEGNVTLDGHNATVSAQLDGAAIAGSIRAFFFKQSFTGTQIA